MKRISLNHSSSTKQSTVIRDPRRAPQRRDQVIIGDTVLTVEFVSDPGPTVSLIGYRTTGPEGQRVVGLTEWQQMCNDADGAIDPLADFN